MSEPSLVKATRIENRPALVLYLDAKGQPVKEEARAALVRVIFTDDKGGSMFLKPRDKDHD